MRWLLLAVVLAGCSKPLAPLPTDETLTGLGHAGDIALQLERPAEAVAQYRLALARAQERDDAAAIADAGFNVAAAQLQANQPADALRTTEEIRADLARRGRSDPGLDLVTATALFRLDRPAEADRWASRLTRDARVADKAWFLRGLMADGRGDVAGLGQAEASLSASADAADRAELQARLGRDPALALKAADLRRNALDYRGMARALALAAQFTPDRARATDLFLRAGRSAAAQHDPAQARTWLTQALHLTQDAPLRREAERAIRGLSE